MQYLNFRKLDIKICQKPKSGWKTLYSLEWIKDFDMGGLTGYISLSLTNHKGLSTWKIMKANPSTVKFITLTE